MKESDRLERLIRAGREVRCESGRVEANWSRIDRALRLGRKALPVAIGPLAFGAFPLVAKAGVIVLAVGASAGASVLAYHAGDPPEGDPPEALRSAPASSSVPTRGNLVRPPEPSPPSTVESSEPEAPTPGLPSSGGALASASASSPSAGEVELDSTLEELALLRGAKRRLDTGDTAGAIEDLREHARRFPRGVLSDERQAIQLMADCAPSPSTAARTRAARYIQAYPRSIHRSAIARACALGGPRAVSATERPALVEPALAPSSSLGESSSPVAPPRSSTASGPPTASFPASDSASSQSR